MAARILLPVCLVVFVAVTTLGFAQTNTRIGIRPNARMQPFARAECNPGSDCQSPCDNSDRDPVCDQFGRFFRNRCEFKNVNCLNCYRLKMKKAYLANGGHSCTGESISRMLWARSDWNPFED